MNKKKELEEHAAKLEAELLELKQSIASMPDPDEKWVPNKGDHYWFVSGYGHLDSHPWRGDPWDKQRSELGNVFRTIKEAKESIIYKAFHGQAFALPDDGYCYYNDLLGLTEKPPEGVEVEYYSYVNDELRVVDEPSWAKGTLYRWKKEGE